MLSWLSSLSAWDWIGLSGVVLVFGGVAGGYVTRRKKSLPEPSVDDLEPIKLAKKQSLLKRKRWEDAWECLLILGLGVDILALGHQISESANLKAKAANALKQVEELRLANLPMDIGEQFSFANVLKQVSDIQVWLLNLDSPNPRKTAGEMAFCFNEARWKVIDHQEIKYADVGVAIVISRNLWTKQSPRNTSLESNRNRNEIPSNHAN